MAESKEARENKALVLKAFDMLLIPRIEKLGGKVLLDSN